MASAPASTNIHAQRRRDVRCSDIRPKASRATGTQLMPATRPKWATWAAMAPANANETAPRKPATGERRDARRKAKVPRPATHHVTSRLAVHAAVPDSTANRSVKG